MMVGSERLLLVEGDADKHFFEEICKLWRLNTDVQVASPKEVGGYNSKQGVFNQLSMLIQQLNDGSIKRLGVVVDADYQVEHGLGFARTVERVTEVVAPFGFGSVRDVDKPQSGLVFQHSDGFADLGLWVMPDNGQEGMLEDWIKSCIVQTEQSLYQHAAKAVATLAQPKFKSIHRSKAEVATWLAWQKLPGHGLYRAVREDLLDSKSELFVTFRQACVTREKGCAEEGIGIEWHPREPVTWVRIISPLHTSIFSVGFRSRPTLGIAGHEDK